MLKGAICYLINRYGYKEKEEGTWSNIYGSAIRPSQSTNLKFC